MRKTSTCIHRKSAGEQGTIIFNVSTVHYNNSLTAGFKESVRIEDIPDCQVLSSLYRLSIEIHVQASACMCMHIRHADFAVLKPVDGEEIQGIESW